MQSVTATLCHLLLQGCQQLTDSMLLLLLLLLLLHVVPSHGPVWNVLQGIGQHLLCCCSCSSAVGLHQWRGSTHPMQVGQEGLQLRGCGAVLYGLLLLLQLPAGCVLLCSCLLLLHVVTLQHLLLGWALKVTAGTALILAIGSIIGARRVVVVGPAHAVVDAAHAVAAVAALTAGVLGVRVVVVVGVVVAGWGLCDTSSSHCTAPMFLGGLVWVAMGVGMVVVAQKVEGTGAVAVCAVAVCVSVAVAAAVACGVGWCAMRQSRVGADVRQQLLFGKNTYTKQQGMALAHRSTAPQKRTCAQRLLRGCHAEATKQSHTQQQQHRRTLMPCLINQPVHSPLPLVCVAVLLSLTLLGLLPSPWPVPCRRLLASDSLEPLVLPFVLLGWLAALMCFSWMEGLPGDTCSPSSLVSLTSHTTCGQHGADNTSSRGISCGLTQG
jgi:hypothetical protein